jgi:hypothetical protein
MKPERIGQWRFLAAGGSDRGAQRVAAAVARSLKPAVQVSSGTRVGRDTEAVLLAGELRADDATSAT